MDMYQFNQIPSEAQIRKTLRRIIFGKNIYCPMCKTSHVYTTGSRYRCRRCRKRFSLLSHTWLANLKLPLTQFWLVLWCWTTQVPVKQAMSLTKLSELTIRHWYSQFRYHLPKDEAVLGHLVQLDEAYFGGKMGRALFLGKQIGSRKLAWKLLPHTKPCREHAWYFLQECVAPQTTLNTDGASIYREIDQWWPVNHQREIHKKFEFTKTSEIEGMFGVLRTFIRRMYHHVTVDKLPELIGEFCFRFSHPEIFENPRQYLEISLFMVPTR
jgi:transposase-like protein